LQCATPPTFSAKIVEDWQSAIETLRTRLAQPEPAKLWLWKNFVDGRPEYWAFDNPYPRNLNDGDPQTIGQPCGYAIFKPSRDGSNGRTEEQVLREMASVNSKSQPEPEPVAWVLPDFWNHLKTFNCGTAYRMKGDDRQPLYTAPPQREWKYITENEIRDIQMNLQKTRDSGWLSFAAAIEAKLKEKNA
jgi:hypothetical protein